MWEDFKAFAFQGNVVELAIAVIIGGAFGQIVTSLVENIITPLIGGLMSGVHFEGLSYSIGASEVTYGLFLQSVFDLFVISISIFLFILLIFKYKHEDSKEEYVEIISHDNLITDIR